MNKINNTMAIITSDAELLTLANNKQYYFYLEAEQKEIKLFADRVYITDIENAQKSGKTCTEKSFQVSEEHDNNTSALICHICNNYGRTVADFLDWFDLMQSDLGSYTREKKGVNTFSPFIKQKAIKRPIKWTKSHIVKAIFSGQLVDAEQTAYYTDDYAHDAAVNFREGEKINLLELAKDLIESGSSGLWFREEGDKLGINNYTFDSKVARLNF